MKPLHSASTPKAGKDTLVVFLLSHSNLEATTNFANSNYDLNENFSVEDAEGGNEILRFTADRQIMFYGIGEMKNGLESLRQATHKCVESANDWKMTSLAIILAGNRPAGASGAIAEAGILSNYQFLTYKTEKKTHSLNSLVIFDDAAGAKAEVERAHKIARATCVARDLVNEPVITLTAPELAKRAEQYGKEFGFTTEVFNHAKIKSLKMGGLLAVNYGSVDPPTFTIMEWKPKNARNSQPYILVGKGVVYDTGGLSLKPTGNSMDFMKSDMAGAAAVIGTMCAVSATEADIHVIGLVPATDNRPGKNAYTPGDVIKMFDGSTVEVLNTDAEGRMILADALAYAKKYNPALVIDLATLTGAAVIAVGTVGIAMMSTADAATKTAISEAGARVYERLVELPLWEEYGDLLKSDIADCKNIGGRTAGSITAGKFLERFTDYPWVHLDIAGPSFLHAPDSYRGKNGTGVGVRLLTEFLSGYQA